jgi:hypothetical protein
LLEQFKPLVTYLITVQQLAPSTLRRHLNDLFLLGGELISLINTFDEDRRRTPARLLDDNIYPGRRTPCADMSNPVLIKDTIMPPAKKSTPSDPLACKPANSGEEPHCLLRIQSWRPQ